ncbi:hypothetical protein ABTY59_31905 [Streptomyces sp. NPDC096079]|uniref:hypothetical protein n=1 Tax=Streptomyces sp. NPDC096079 TaxID=3155820 RepID=UPI0033229160
MDYRKADNTSSSLIGGLSAVARTLYALLADGAERIEPGTPGLEELLARGLIVANQWKADHYVLLESSDVLRRQVEIELRAVQARVARVLETARLVEELPRRPTSEEGGMKFLATLEECREAVVEITHGVRASIWTAQPVERTPKTMEKSTPRDLDNLVKGVKYRTIYLDSARHQPHQRTWAEKVTELGGEVRTLPGGFQRMVIVDGKEANGRAIISDHRPGPGYLSRNTGWLVTNAGMVAQLVAVYEEQWNRADPWTGGYARFASSVGFTSDDEKILRGLLERRTHESIAGELGVDLRTITNRLGRIYKSLGLNGGDKFSLGMAYERHLAQRQERPQAADQ